MSDLLMISLNANWRYQLTDDDDDNLSSTRLDDSDWPQLQDLDDLASQVGDPESVVWLRRKARIRMMDFCVTFFLDIQQVPEETDFYINGKYIGTHKPNKGRFAIDVTPQVFLGDNVIALRMVRAPVDQTFGEFSLNAVPCD